MESRNMSIHSVSAQTRQPHAVWRSVLRAVSLMIIFVALLYAKTAYNASQDFALGEDAYTHGEYKRAITHYERTIKWYTPLSTAVQRAVERLWQLGTEAEARGEISLALEAYQTLRSSLYAVQSFYIPYQSWIPKSEERIAPLLAKTKAGEEPNAGQTGARHSALCHAAPTACGPASGMVDPARNRFSWLGRCDRRPDLVRCG